MEIINKDLGSFHLHLIPTDQFKTITLKVIFHAPIEKDKITKRNLLLDLLLQSSLNYKSRRELTIQAEELYSVDIYTNNQRLGNYMVTSMNMQVLNDKFTEVGNMEKAICFFCELLFHPDVLNQTFSKKNFDLVSKNTKIALESIKEEASNYAMIRMAEEFSSDSIFSYRMMGYLEDLEKIDEKEVYRSYLDMIQNDLVDIFVVGDFDINNMISLIKKNFKFKMFKKEKGPYELDCIKIRRNPYFYKESSSNNQSRLVMACPYKSLSSFEENYVLPLFNIILGGGVDSKLFREVREKYSLCYSIHSMVKRLDHLFIITAGIDLENASKTIALIKDIFGDCRKGKISEGELMTAKEYYTSSLEEICEVEERFITEVFFEEVLKIPKIDVRREEILKVTRQDLIKLSKKIKIDTIYLLEGGNILEKD